MKLKKENSKWYFILFPAVAMMLGWGLRGHIGGGPYGAMIPGAMVALCIGMLLELPAWTTSILVVFSVFGIGMGGEMTYGQTLGFLRNPETVWWGTAGTTLKGAVWGLLGGIILSIGFYFRKIPKKTFVVAFLLMIAAMLVGFKLINDPMILYFSDPEKPRAESWAALLFGAIALLVYLKLKVDKSDYKVISRFAIWGLIGGALGFGLGGFWMVLGSRLPDVVFTSWWKSMEFWFGFLFGGTLGYATWLSRKEPYLVSLKEQGFPVLKNLSEWKELAIISATGLLIFWLIPHTIEWFTEAAIENNMEGGSMKQEIARLLDSYAMSGLIFILVLLRYPKIGWQIGITLTFCYTAIDLFRDFYPGTNTLTPFTMHFFWVLLTTAVVAVLVSWFSRKPNSMSNLFLLLIWSCISISVIRMFVHMENFNVANLSLCQIICGRFIVDIFFVVSAIGLTLFIIKKQGNQ